MSRWRGAPRACPARPSRRRTTPRARHRGRDRPTDPPGRWAPTPRPYYLQWTDVGLLLRSVRVDGAIVDLRAGPAGIEAIGAGLAPRPSDEILDGAGGAVIPGLHDHHLHLLAMAAASTSVRVGPPDVADARDLAAVLAAADRSLPARAWLRAVGYHESVAGPLDRTVLDRLVPGRPVRVQDRSGADWSVNSPAVHELGLDQVHLSGVDRDASGTPTG